MRGLGVKGVQKALDLGLVVVSQHLVCVDRTADQLVGNLATAQLTHRCVDAVDAGVEVHIVVDETETCPVLHDAR